MNGLKKGLGKEEVDVLRIRLYDPSLICDSNARVKAIVGAERSRGESLSSTE
jgi:hypothetical protein